MHMNALYLVLQLQAKITARDVHGWGTQGGGLLRAATRILTLHVYSGSRWCVGVAYRISLYSTKSRSHGRFLPRSQGHWQLSSVVTWS